MNWGGGLLPLISWGIDLKEKDRGGERREKKGERRWGDEREDGEGERSKDGEVNLGGN